MCTVFLFFLSSTCLWANLHLYIVYIAATSGPVNMWMWPGECSVATRTIPPSGSSTFSTISDAPGIVVFVISRKTSSILICHVISTRTRLLQLTNVQPELLFCSIYSEEPISVCQTCSIYKSQLNAEVHLLSGGEAVNVAKSIPKFSVQISKSMFVFTPSTCEVNLL